VRLRKWSDNIDVNLLKTLIWKVKVLQGGSGMSLDFGLLAGQTGSCPSTDISIKPVPHETCPD
jgi:hypothetical protein